MATRATGVTDDLTTTATAVLTAGPNEAIVFTNVIAMNRDSTARVVTLYQVPSAGSAGATNQIITQSVYAGQSTSIPIGAVVIANGASLHAMIDSGTSVNLSLNYYTTDQQA